MSDWQERITRETAPTIRAEHELRYGAAAPLISTSSVWADLGCGTGVAAAAAVAGTLPAQIVLVDVEEEVVAGAARELQGDGAVQLVGDLTDPEVLRRIGESLLAVDGERIVTCFEVVEHLRTFVPLLEWSGSLARDGAATFVISVPNDAFWSIENPYHASSWGESAFEELRLLLPEERTLMRQVAVTGSALVDWDSTPARHDVALEVGGDAAVATHFIAAFGPRHQELGSGAVAVQTDLLEQRRWERQRESNLAVAEATVRQQHETLERQRTELQGLIAEFDTWRTYIHELELELGRPPSGQQAAP